jgi:CBS domain-containing protein
MKVRQLMTRYVWTVQPGDGLDRAARMMQGRGCGCLPVVDAHGHVEGMLTDRDICMTLVREAARPSSLQVKHAMRQPAFACSPDDGLECAEALMAQHRVRRLPVVDDAGRLVGLLSIDDIARRASRDVEPLVWSTSPEAVGRTLGGIVTQAS